MNGNAKDEPGLEGCSGDPDGRAQKPDQGFFNDGLKTPRGALLSSLQPQARLAALPEVALGIDASGTANEAVREKPPLKL